MSEVEELQAKLEKMELALGAAREREAIAKKELEAKLKSNQFTEARPLYVTSRKLEKFRDRPQTASDPSVHEWIGDMRAHLDGQRLSTEQKAAVVMEHLAGRARLEVQGRGIGVASDPAEIFLVLSKVFGDGDSLEQLMSRFFAYQQRPSEDLVTTSLELLSIFQRMVDLDRSLDGNGHKMLKDRIAEAVADEGLRRELRRLNVESPSLTYFELRDRAIHWLGNNSTPVLKKAINHEVPSSCTLDSLTQMVRDQQELFKTLAEEIKEVRSYSRGRGINNQGQRVCFNCNKADHMIRDCPTRPKRRRYSGERDVEILKLKEQVQKLQAAQDAISSEPSSKPSNS